LAIVIAQVQVLDAHADIVPHPERVLWCDVRFAARESGKNCQSAVSGIPGRRYCSLCTIGTSRCPDREG
jgi:hypothetical protein